MKNKPDLKDIPEITRLILEKLVMERHWMHNHIAEENIPKSLPSKFPASWYTYLIHELKRKGILVSFKEHGKVLYGLNIKLKTEIQRYIGTRVKAQTSSV